MLSYLRPAHWVKNILLGVPLLVSHRYSDIKLLGALILAFCSFSLAASAVYLVNDFFDYESDRLHPEKSKRSQASGKLSPRFAILIALFLGLSSLAIGTLLPGFYNTILLIYFSLTTAYSIKIKKVPMLDIIFLSAFYSLRVLAGAFAVDVEPSAWLLAFSFFIFLSLAHLKRYNELKDLPIARGYTDRDLPLLLNFGVSSAVGSVMILAFYIQNEQASLLYKSPKLLWICCLILFYWFMRSWFISHRMKASDDTVIMAVKDPVSLICAAAFLCVLLLARFV